MELFVVEITAAPERPREQSVNHMVTAFKVDETKATRLLERVERRDGPVTVSRPTPERDALRNARSFQAIGFEVRIRPYTPRPELGEAPNPSVSPETQVAVAQPSFERTAALVPPAPSEVASEGMVVDDPTPVPPPAPDGFLSEQASLAAGNSFNQPTSRESRTAEVARLDAPLEYTLEEPEERAAMPDSTIKAPRASGRVSLRSKFLLAAILPTLLTVASAVAAILLTVPGALRGLLLESARNPAIALAGGVGGLIPGNALDGKTIGQLQNALELSRTTFSNQNVQFVMVTDAIGNPVAGWYGQEPSLAAVPSQVRAYVQTQARRATARAYMQNNSIPLGTYNPPSRLVDAAGTPLEVAAYPITRDANTIGTAVVGMSSQAISSRVQGTLITTLIASTLPVILAVLIAMLLARSITTNVIRLVKAADRISLGQLEEPVGLRTNDELNELGEALERMRVSLQESLERLRRRRR